ncbi:MAG: (d)CMP kinase [Actinomycetales bacterium]|nr:(d)CMP kinase [Actinomycetales bacterium]MBP8880914.1 (d)CMP kinase [Dermatophilaceae bacterium]
MIIAIDGAAATGKSTVCRSLAGNLGYPYFNAGLLYRAVTLWTLNSGAEVGQLDPHLVSEACSSLSVEFVALATRIIIHGEDVTSRLGDPEVVAGVPRTSANTAVRSSLMEVQREVARRCLAASGGVVVDGRDATTLVWPEAEVRVLLVSGTNFGKNGEEVSTRNSLDSTHTDFFTDRPGISTIRTTPESLDDVVRKILLMVSAHSAL